MQDLDGEHLKRATGLPPAKAMRALAIVFGLVPAPTSKWPVTCLSSEAMEQLVRGLANPFDLLMHTDVASVLDIGAGDLSFAEELADQYGPQLHQRNRQLIFHGVDRLDPHSRLGGPLHADPSRLRRLQQKQGLSFAFFGRQDMFDLSDLDGQDLLARLKRAWERRDVDQLVGLFREDAELRPDPFEAPFVGELAIRGFWTGAAAASANVEFDAERGWVAGTTVLASWHGAITERTTGQRTRQRGFLSAELDADGLISRMREWMVVRVIGVDGGFKVEPPETQEGPDGR